MMEAWVLARTMNIWGTHTAWATGVKVIGRSMCAELQWSKAFPLLSSRLEIFQAVRVKGFYFKDYLSVCVCARALSDARRRYQISWSWLPGSCEPLDVGVGNQTQVPLEKQQELLTVELYPMIFLAYLCIHFVCVCGGGGVHATLEVQRAEGQPEGLSSLLPPGESWEWNASHQAQG